MFFLDFFYKSSDRKINSSKYILIVRTDLLGDFIIWLNALILIAQKFRKEHYKIIFAGNEIWMSLADKTKEFDILIPINRKKYFKDFAYRKNILNDINKYEIEYLFQTAYSRDFAVADSLTRNINAKHKIAFRRKPKAEYSLWNFLSNNWYSKLLKADTEHQFEFYRIKEFLSELKIFTGGYTTDLASYFKINEAPKKYFVVFPGANAARRCLEFNKFAQLIKKINAATNWECYLCGSEKEKELGKNIESNLDFKIVNLIGKTSLAELGDILLNSEFVLGNETGTLHYAVAMNKKTFCILGGGHFGRFMPYDKNISGNLSLPVAAYIKMKCFNCNWRCIYTAKENEIVPCISQLTTDFLWEKILPMLN